MDNRFLILTREIGVYPKNTIQVSSGWGDNFGIYKEIPEDMNNYIYECNKVFDQLQHFALPNQKTNLTLRQHSENANQYFKKICI